MLKAYGVTELKSIAKEWLKRYNVHLGTPA